MSGVRKIGIQDLVIQYCHVAIFRQPHAWSPDRVRAMNLFIEKIIQAGAKYKVDVIWKFVKDKKEHNESIFQKLESFFNGSLAPDAVEKGKYFCSELVVDCLVSTGFIDPSAAILYKSNTFSPGDLGEDPTFGTFLGYISLRENYEVPSDDVFLSRGPYDEIL